MREFDGEVVILDDRQHVAHQLSVEAVTVWRACDGQRDAGAIGEHAGIPSARVEEILAQLEARDLIFDAAAPSADTRRAMLRKAVLTGAVIAGVPAITSVLVPTAAHAFTSQPPDQNPGNGSQSPGGSPPANAGTTETTAGSSTPNTANSSNPTSGSSGPKGTNHGSSRGPRGSGGPGGSGGGSAPTIAGAGNTRGPAVANAGGGGGAGGGGTRHIGARRLPFTGSNVIESVVAGGALVAAGVAAKKAAGPPPRESS